MFRNAGFVVYTTGRNDKISWVAPKIALLKKNGKTEEVGIEALRLGNVIMVKPNSKISADGVMVKGQNSVNHVPIAGENVP